MKSTALLLLLAASAFAQSISIVSGPVDYQVYQRGTDGKAEIPLELKVEGDEGKDVFLSIKRGVVPVPGFVALNLGKAVNGVLKTTVRNVPTGGPYRLEFRLRRVGAAIHARSNVLVGDIWLLAGQSNMEGVGNLENVEQPSDRVNSYNQADAWVPAKEPLHELVSATDRVHWRKNAAGVAERLEGEALEAYRANRKKGAGLGLAFAIEYEKRTGVPVGLLPCAHGGTSMAQWSPELKDKGGDSLYGATLRRAQLVGGKVAGILWYQGESDASAQAAPIFQQKFEELVKAFRQDLNAPELPFYYAQIGRHVSAAPGAPWNQVQEGQRLAETMLPRSAMFATIDTDLDDGIHVSTPELKRLGRVMAGYAAGKIKKGPTLVSLALEGQTVRVKYRDVNGKLVAPGRVLGFYAVNGAGEVVPLIYKVTFDPNEPASVLLHFQGKAPEGLKIGYGYGRDPIANLRDEMGAAAPVFLPQAVNP
ncbi:MAG: sialate O-acetylesterase [Bryobacter sp.]|nr:sialate O-acetylesterase [Bryobacter sp.]